MCARFLKRTGCFHSDVDFGVMTHLAGDVHDLEPGGVGPQLKALRVRDCEDVFLEVPNASQRNNKSETNHQGREPAHETSGALGVVLCTSQKHG